MTGSIPVRKVRFSRLERSVKKFTDSLGFSKEGLRLTICGKCSWDFLDARSKYFSNFDLHNRIFIHSSQRKSGVCFRFYRILFQRTFVLDSSAGIYDSRYFDSYGKSTVDKKISFGSGDFSLDSLYSNAHTFYRDSDSSSNRVEYFRRIESSSISYFDFYNVRSRIFTFFYPRIFGQGERDFKGYYSSHSSYFSVLFWSLPILYVSSGFLYSINVWNPLNFPLELFRFCLLNDFVSVFHWKEFIPSLILFPLIGILSRSKFHSVILDHL